MKIVFLAPFGIRPKGTVIARMVPLARELTKRGHEVVVIAPPYTNPEDSGRSETVDGVTLRNVSLGPGNKIFAALAISWRMFRAAREEKPELLHLFKPKGYGGLAAMLHLMLRRLGFSLPPLVVDTDDWEGKGGMNALHPYSSSERLVFQLQEQWLLPAAAGVTVASRTLQTKAWGLGIRPERVLYLPNCVDSGERRSGEAVRGRMGIPADAPVLLLYTRFFEFSQEKLHYIFAEVHCRLPEAVFLVAGKGRKGEEELLFQAGREKGFAGAIKMAGWLQPEEIYDVLSAGDVAIYPFADTLINRSKCPAKVTEILRAGVPVVADNVGQLAEYVKPGSSGYLCDPEKWDEMVERVVELLADKSAGRAMGESGRQYLLDNFNWFAHAGKLASFYAETLQNTCFRDFIHD